jgi:GNAT superfamily N-acetyltransferase
MPPDNLERMIRLADEVFAVRNDPTQIAVDEETMRRLRQVHPSTMSEEVDENGPVAWMLVFPTTRSLMNQFLEKNITERELLEQTPLGTRYDVLYLCSALVLREHRGKGIAKRLVVDAIRSIQRDHPIAALFVWSFSAEGKGLAHAVAEELSLPLFEREE